MTEPEARPWIVCQSAQEIEAWIDRLNHELQQIAGARQPTAASHHAGLGVCLTLTHGGEITLHTNPDGDVLLDLGPEADWVTPLIIAATSMPEPRGKLWLIPGDRLIQLLLGLNSLIESEKIVLRHNFRGRI
ncbi:MAG: hypothetical protein ABI351_05775 [Herbaspirillum sp.]